MSKAVKVISIVIGAVSFLTVLCIVFAYLFNNFSPNSYQNKSNAFLSAISQKNYSDAFDSLTPELKDKVGQPENLPNYIGINSGIKSFSLFKRGSWGNWTEIWKVIYEDNSIQYFWITFKRENDGLKIDKVELHN